MARYRAVLNALKALHLTPGTILVVSDPIVMKQLQNLRVPGIDFPVPIVFAKDGTLKSVKVEDLQAALNQAKPLVVIPWG